VRVLRLAVDADHVVDLHPHLSVVAGLAPAQAAALRRAVAAVAAGLAPVGGGLLEAQGFLLDAAQPDLDLLDLGARPQHSVLTGALALADPPGDEEALARLRTAERDVLLLATDRCWAARARAAEGHAAAPPSEAARAEQLRLALGAHAATDVEPLRRALDADRDARRAGAPTAATVAALAGALADLGLDLRPHPVEDDEVRRLAEDLLEEQRRHAAWAVGARVELDGIERRLAHRPRAARPGAATAALLPEAGQRRLELATAALADAIARADELRDQLRAPVPAATLAEPLVQHAAERRGDAPAGATPLLLDRPFDAWPEGDVVALLEQLEPLARRVQLLVVDDHPAAVAWAEAAGRTRAAVVPPGPGSGRGRTPTMRSTTT